MNSKVWDRFDFKGAIYYCGNVKTRIPDFEREIDRVGLMDVRPFYNCRTAYDELLQRAVVHSGKMNNIAPFSTTLAHLRMVRYAFEIGAEHALFFEDDVRFLKDVNDVIDFVESLPEDYDLALFDWVHRKKATDDEIRVMNDAAQNGGGTWIPIEVDLRSCAMYALSRRAMSYYVGLLEAPAQNWGRLKICDQYWSRFVEAGFKCVCAAKPVAVQGAGDGYTSDDYMWGKYSRAGVRREDYA